MEKHLKSPSRPNQPLADQRVAAKPRMRVKLTRLQEKPGQQAMSLRKIRRPLQATGTQNAHAAIVAVGTGLVTKRKRPIRRVLTELPDLPVVAARETPNPKTTATNQRPAELRPRPRKRLHQNSAHQTKHVSLRKKYLRRASACRYVIAIHWARAHLPNRLQKPRR